MADVNGENERAARVHWTSFGVGIGLFWSVARSRDASPHVAHHARQATIMNVAIIALLILHSLIHGLIHIAQRINAWAEELGGDATPQWAITIVAVLIGVNWAAMSIELLVAVVLSARMRASARRGERPEYFFAKKRA